MPDNSYDCVYFDPMFEENIFESDGIKGVRSLAIYEALTKETIDHAYRVAKESVVLKDHFRSLRFEQFGFQVQVRKKHQISFWYFRKVKVL